MLQKSRQLVTDLLRGSQACRVCRQLVTRKLETSPTSPRGSYEEVNDVTRKLRGTGPSGIWHLLILAGLLFYGLLSSESRRQPAKLRYVVMHYRAFSHVTEGLWWSNRDCRWVTCVLRPQRVSGPQNLHFKHWSNWSGTNVKLHLALIRHGQQQHNDVKCGDWKNKNSNISRPSGTTVLENYRESCGQNWGPPSKSTHWWEQAVCCSAISSPTSNIILDTWWDSIENSAMTKLSERIALDWARFNVPLDTF